MPIHVSETMPGDELIVTTKNETLACKVVAVTLRREPQVCCTGFKDNVRQGIFGGNDNCRDGSWWVLGESKWRMYRCPFCGAKLKE